MSISIRVFALLQLLGQRGHTDVAGPASALWPSTLWLSGTRSGWVMKVGSHRGRRTRSGTAWCSAAARWRPRRGFAWGLKEICPTGKEPCAWALPTCRPRTGLCLCPLWPFPTSPMSKATGPPHCINPTAKKVQSWSSGSLMEAACTWEASTSSSISYWQEWISAVRFGPW